jgi:hypothetical protein
MFCLRTRFVAWNYCAAPGLAFTGGAHGQGDRVKGARTLGDGSGRRYRIGGGGLYGARALEDGTVGSEPH